MSALHDKARAMVADPERDSPYEHIAVIAALLAENERFRGPIRTSESLDWSLSAADISAQYRAMAIDVERLLRGNAICTHSAFDGCDCYAPTEVVATEDDLRRVIADQGHQIRIMRSALASQAAGFARPVDAVLHGQMVPCRTWGNS